MRKIFAKKICSCIFTMGMICLFCLCGCSATGYGTEKEISNGENIKISDTQIPETNEEDLGKYDKPQITGPKDDIGFTMPPAGLEKQTIEEQNKEILVSDFGLYSIRVDKIEYKDRITEKKEFWRFLDNSIIDNSGKAKDCSIIYITMTILNKVKSKIQYSFGQEPIIYFDGEFQQEVETFESYYCNKISKEKMNKLHGARDIYLNPDESITYTEGFIIENKMLKKDLYILVSGGLYSKGEILVPLNKNK